MTQDSRIPPPPVSENPGSSALNNCVHDHFHHARYRPSKHQVPVIFVDLDGTLIATDLLHEALIHTVRSDLLYLLRIPLWASNGSLTLKNELSAPACSKRQPYPAADTQQRITRRLTSELQLQVSKRRTD